jgi:[acyl-carrier-protein] S-malonyltransferase
MIAFIFPGQGAQYLGMGKDLYETFPESKTVFDKADMILNLPLSKLCFEGPIEELTRTVNCQPAVFTVSIAALKALSAMRPTLSATYMAGLSLGEYTALVAAGALSFEDGLSLVASRAKFMDEAAREKAGKMSSILGLGTDIIEKISHESGVEIANLNCPGQVVVSGTTEAINKANSLASEYGAKGVVNLEVSGAFHSSLMESAAQKLTEVLNNINIKQPEFAVVSNVTASPETSPSQIKDNLVRQLTSSVYWEKSVRFMIEQGVSKFFEIGPGKVLKGLIRKTAPNLEVANIENKADIVASE